MSLSQQQKDFLVVSLAASTTSGQLLDLILGVSQGGVGPGLPETVDPPGPRGYKVDCAQYLLSLATTQGDKRDLVTSLLY